MKHGCRITIVAAVADNGVIGAGGGMPWRLRSDLRRFKQLTMGKPVVMGRRTFESLGRPLAGRTNIVVGRGNGEGAIFVPTLAAALEAAAASAAGQGDPEIMVIGGGAIYAAALPVADRLCLTHVHATPDGDTFFPDFDRTQWHVTGRSEIAAGPEDSAATTYTTYERAK